MSGLRHERNLIFKDVEMFYFLNISYTPNTASTNRLLGHYSAFDNLGIKGTIVYLIPDSEKHKMEGQYKNIEVKYYWGRLFPDSTVSRFFLFRWNLLRFIHSLKEGDIVYTYGINYCTKILVSCSKIKTFAEITEHPSILDGGKTTAILESQKYEVATKLDRLFVISNALKGLFVSHGVKGSNIQVVNMTVDPSRFENLLKQKNKDRYIAYCGNASNNKDGVDKLLKAFKIVSQFHPEIKLYVIGKAPSKDVADGNYQLAQELGIIDKVVFTGMIPAVKIPQLLKNAEVLLLNRPDSRQATFGFPTKLGEYLLTGNPVVVTKVGDIPTFLIDGESALLSSPSNDSEFASKICWALNNPESAIIIGEKGRNVALRYFDSNKEVLKIVEALN